LYSLLLIVHVLICIGLMVTILMQSAKGEGLAGAFGGSGITGAVFGGRGAATFLTKASTIMGIAFFVSALTLTFLTPAMRAGRAPTGSEIQEEARKESQESSVPATSVPTTVPQEEEGKSVFPSAPEEEKDKK
jgi:preprotein translocase subunit SecG